MASHLLVLVLFSALVSTVLALVMRDDRRARLRFGVLAFLAFVVSALAVGWLMYPFPQ
jgi:prepilin signal peptidase PulO-like enzyme (type II secretory pathway)